VDLWIEETGYFYKNGSQRVLTVGNHALLNGLVNLLENVNSAFGGMTRHRKRPLNKAFGAERCPCLAHLLKGQPYIAIGPNDDHSTVHGPNESISINLLEQSAAHLEAILKHMEALE
jgi:acetylornithine deacetylase/succinyl-diaminopimelate desuccinylase-like protein